MHKGVDFYLRVKWSLRFADGLLPAFAGRLIFAVCGSDTHPVAHPMYQMGAYTDTI